MCLSIPAKILSIEGDIAKVSAGGTIFTAGLQMIEDAREGDWVLLHAGFAIQKLNENDAQETVRMFEELKKASSK